ncbi:septum formation protein Maf [Candidatus Bathyarchaeota archaeon]|nr:septum formation protein Maf [Candidatus Bathyarchaeota archaeon]MBL7078999.1 septum formation protein Maf [Candidatus Bathyarchaeota archaeon]
MTRPFKIVLASTSPRRRELLERLGVPFDVIAPDGVEETQEGDPREVVTRNASAKASEVAGGLSEGLVVGADTVVVVDDIIMGKAEDPLEARVMLAALKGRMHKVLTGLAVLDAETGRRDVAVVETKVWIHPLTGEEIGEYVSTGEPIGKAGGYAIQGAGGALVERIEGCYENVVGLPLSRLRSMLEGFGLETPS